jgi:hypothetical protein
MMKIAIGLLVVTLSANLASAQSYGSNNRGSSYGVGGGGLSGTGSNSQSHYVAPHLNSNGSYTGGHTQTNPNNTQLDNYGTRGNYNPNTGAFGNRGARY